MTATTMLVLVSRQLPVHLTLPPPQLALPLPLGHKMPSALLLHSEDLLVMVHAARPPLFVLGCSLSVPRCGRGGIGGGGGGGGSALALT